MLKPTSATEGPTVFHTYVRAASGRVIDFDRATWLMDKALLRQVEAEMEEERTTAPIDGATYGAQWLWGRYCSLHFEKYGEGFAPNEDPDWDAPPPPKPLTPEEVAELDSYTVFWRPGGFYLIDRCCCGRREGLRAGPAPEDPPPPGAE